MDVIGRLSHVLLLFVMFTRALARSDYSDYDVNTVPGIPGKDYPVLAHVPPNDFYCEGKMAGYYADPYFGCQVYHKCDIDDRKDSFLCSNGTIFNQKTFVCEWWYSVDCSLSDYYYGKNAELYQTHGPSYPSHGQYHAPQPAYVSGVSHYSVPVALSSYSKPKPSSYRRPKPADNSYSSSVYKGTHHHEGFGHTYSDEVSSKEVYNPKPVHKAPSKQPVEYIDSYESLSNHHESSPVKVYKAQPLSHDGKAQVEPMSHKGHK